ncbi:MAG: transaldolase [Chloroflexi bacterium]|nr:MAG: transaldolase [Chloroflexota bacterium]
MNQIQKLQQLGQSIWLDYIERSMVQSGELKQLVDEGLTGVTSNPTIFQQAIATSPAYQDDLQQLVAGSQDAKAIFETLAVADIQAAADVLRPVYEKSNRRDGYVSIEVAPDLAYDADATIAEARRLFAAVDRPNVMVKVPATKPGIDAIRQLIGDGININVTLIFGLERYAAVKEAYFQGLEKRLAAGQPIDQIASVASFFVSRVDTNVDGKLEKLAAHDGRQLQSLLGKAAVANAKLAYAQFQQKFSGARWEKLAAAGAQLQRPLWASTSTKNPNYPDLLYVDPLIGPHTVNTMPLKTLDAFRDHGVIAQTVTQGVDEAEALFARLAELGISMKQVADELEVDGVKKFADSYNELLKEIEQKRRELQGSAVAA